MAKNGIVTPYDDNAVPIATTITGTAGLVQTNGVAPAPQYAKLGTHPGLPALTGLSAATATGAGAVFNLMLCHGNFTMAVTVTGAPASCAVQLQGSLDNTNWYNMGSATSNTSGTAVVNATNMPAQYVRANLTTLSGGTSPTVTAVIGCSG